MDKRRPRLGKLSRLLFHLKMWMRKYLFFYSEAPDGTKYLSILQFGPHGLVERRVFVVTGEILPASPSIAGLKVKKLFVK